MNSMLKTVGKGLVAVHRRLLPDIADIGWTPYLWLVYLGFLFFPIIMGNPSTLLVQATAAGTVLFLGLYFYGFWCRGVRLLPSIVGICLIGAALAPLNPGAAVFFIYAAGFVGQLGTIRKGIIGLVLILTLAVLVKLVLNLHLGFLLPALIFGTLVGMINLYYADLSRKRSALRLSHEEVRRLAATTERERIARDLHDLLGHTLSLVTLKSELARKLLDRDIDRARDEIEDLERISRSALAEVREAVAGYRNADLATELANARLALDVAGIDFRYDTEGSTIPPEIDNVLSMCLREAVTNVVRHARASRCQVRCANNGDRVLLTIIDNGRSGSINEGAGLTGMRERLTSISGTLAIASNNGTELTIRVPFPSKAVSTDQELVESQVA